MMNDVNSILTITSEDLDRLGPELAVDRFRQLLWAEASRLGISRSLVDVPSAITVADGGIDAEVVVEQDIDTSGLIVPGITRYQIKAGDFKVGQPSKVREILFTQAGELKPRVKTCLDRDGTLVVVLFGGDNPDQTDESAVVEKFKAQLIAKDEKYANASVQVLRQNQLLGQFAQYPSLALLLNGRGTNPFQTHDSWSGNGDMSAPFVKGPGFTEKSDELRQALVTNSDALHVHVAGEAGIGKTRFVLEATKPDHIAPLVIYCGSPSSVLTNNLLNEIARTDNGFEVILIVDECGLGDRSLIWNLLTNRGRRIRFISIHNDDPVTSNQTRSLEPERLENEQVESIIRSYGVQEDAAGRFGPMCEGSPRAAHILGENLRNNPEDLLRSLSYADVWDRWVVGPDEPSSRQVERRRTILRFLALFKRVGYSGAHRAERKQVLELIQKADPEITEHIFVETIEKLRQRRILQGENTLYISPKLLHVKQWVDWWNTWGTTFELNEFTDGMRPQLVEWFFDMFRYAARSEAASRVAKELLGPDGVFPDDELLRTELGGNLFLALTEAEPSSGLACLERTIGDKTTAELLQLTTGRRQMVWALEKIAFDRALFPRATRLLLALSTAENETWSNSATGIFTGLFSPAPGPVAATSAPLAERFPILEEALRSDDTEVQAIGVNAADSALSTGPFSRTVGAERRGIEPDIEPWFPKDRTEFIEGYRRAWELLDSVRSKLDQELATSARETLLERARGLLRGQFIDETIIGTFESLLAESADNTKPVLKTVLSILHYESDGLSADTRASLEQLRDRLSGSDFGGALRRYVGTDLLEDRFDDQGQHADTKAEHIHELALEAVEYPDRLLAELEWLVTSAAEDGFRFGYEVGLRDEGRSLLPSLLEAQESCAEECSLMFLGGYFRALAERDLPAWESEIDAMAESEGRTKWIAELTWRSNMPSENAAIRIADLAEVGIITIEQFNMFVYGGVINKLSMQTFERWIRYLLDLGTRFSVSIALELVNMRIHRDRPALESLPEELLTDVLTHENWFEPHVDEPARGFGNQQWTWNDVAKAYLSVHPEQSLRLAEPLLEHLGEDGTIAGGAVPHILDVLTEITKIDPSGVWSLVSGYLDPPLDTRSFDLRHWLGGSNAFNRTGEGPLKLIPPEKIWEWIDANIEERAWNVAGLLPTDLFDEGREDRPSLTRTYLVRYGDRKDVRSNLHANYGTGGWMGSASEHFAQEKRKYEALLAEETEPRVIHWLREAIDDLERSIERERSREERQD